ncbi:hypothetical protein Poli38472_007720 [Pythium oligandrum]|uniref:Glutathione transferase n=1 Tax=Pythium oligandrum TaxID=41045 RepID=A0A8K1CTK8_PYTOL|nr:hypothetical protein Poli38472_007720 [Pythium oligandrum]|eukprot:TMW68048.1 hypothetical protein Poli38472_007720 [Pythium oligandrum]
MEQIYAFPVSQPARAVVWLCKLNNHAIEIKTVNMQKGETKTETFKKEVSPIGKIPVMKDGDFMLTESHAIMIYLAEKHGWEQWYPRDPKVRARIHEYMNWHHHNARLSSEVFFNVLMKNLGRSTPAVEASLKKKGRTVGAILKILEFWLEREGNEYLASKLHPTLADMSCYNEVVQLEVMGELVGLETKYPKFFAWLKRMKSLPHHDEELAGMMKFFHKFKLIPAKM